MVTAAAGDHAHAPRGRSAPGGVVLWGTLLTGIACWTVHVLAEASLVPISRHHHRIVWWMHGLTALLALVTAAALVASARLARPGPADDGDGSPVGATAFLGLLGVLLNGVSLLLIVVEGVYVGVLWNRA